MTADHSAPAYRHNGQPIGADDFYAIACNPQRHVAVEACAGAGKTWMLVSRMLRALLAAADNGPLTLQPRQILAITFTKRAAAEMRQRLHEWLVEFAHADTPALLQALRQRGIDTSDELAAKQLCGRLSNLYARILRSGQQVQVRTFHGWFATLLRGAPLAFLQQMQLPPDYELLEDDAPAKALVWRRLLAALVLQADLKADYEALVFAYGRSQIDRALQAALDKRTEFLLADAHGVVQRSVLAFFEQYPEFAGLDTPDDFLRRDAAARHTLLTAARALAHAAAPSFADKGVALEQGLSADNGDAVLAALLTLTGEARKFNEKIVGIELIRAAQEIAQRLAHAREQHAAWLYQQRMTRLTRLLLQTYGALKRERGWVDMNDVEHAASLLLSDDVLCGWLQEQLDLRIKHLLIDEFQDTNPLQWLALKSWLAGYAGAASVPSVFIVGDPKQSIYRFRRAEPQVFVAAQTFIRNALGGDLLSCDHTRRSSRQVLDAINAVMTEAAQNDAYPGFRTHTTGSSQLGQVLRLPLIARPPRAGSDGSDRLDDSALAEHWRDSLGTPREAAQDSLHQAEARQAAQWIAQQLAQGSVASQHIMVLAHKHSALRPLQDELRRLHIAAQLGEKTELIDCCEVQDIVALLDVLLSPQHDLSLARALKSPLFNWRDADLVALALACADGSQCWFDKLSCIGGAVPDGIAVAARLQRWKKWLDELPPHDALQSIYSDGDVLARFAAAAPLDQRELVVANLRSLLGVTLQLGAGRFATPYALVRTLKAGGLLTSAALNAQAVRLLTIHAAKGLQASSVLLLDSDTPQRNAESMTLLIAWPGEAGWPAKFVFLASESHAPACALATLQAEQQERQREELNALYVALTRAQSTLVISGNEAYRTAQNSWWQRLVKLATPTAQALGQPTLARPTALPKAAGGVDFCLTELPSSNTSVIAPSAGAKPLTAQPTLAARIGSAMHRLLQWGTLRAGHLAGVARAFGLSPAQAAEAARLAQCIRHGEAAWAWDSAELNWQGDEVELLHQGQRLRIDRLVQRSAGEWWVLDYKLDPAPQQQDALLAQLRRYRDGVQAIYPQATVRAAFLTAKGALIEPE